MVSCCFVVSATSTATVTTRCLITVAPASAAAARSRRDSNSLSRQHGPTLGPFSEVSHRHYPTRLGQVPEKLLPQLPTSRVPSYRRGSWRARSAERPSDDIFPSAAFKDDDDSAGRHWADELTPWREFGQAEKFARSLGLESQQEWEVWAKSSERPPDIPVAPEIAYSEDGWISWQHWLGCKSPRRFRDYGSAKRFASDLGLESQQEWEAWARGEERPEDIPEAPDVVYKGWEGWDDWLGTATRKWKAFFVARLFARRLGLESQQEWEAWAKSSERPSDIPEAPDVVYDESWEGWEYWLGTAGRQWRSFEQARMFARDLGLESQQEWEAWAHGEERPAGIPEAPDVVYDDEGWDSWEDWLGIRIARQSWRGFRDARKFAQQLGFETQQEWEAWARGDERPSDIPEAPDVMYFDQGWRSWNDFLRPS